MFMIMIYYVNSTSIYLCFNLLDCLQDIENGIYEDSWQDPEIVPECLSSQLRTFISCRGRKCELQFVLYVPHLEFQLNIGFYVVKIHSGSSQVLFFLFLLFFILVISIAINFWQLVISIKCRYSKRMTM